MAAVPSPHPPADDAPHLLVVDDDRRIRDLLSRFLSTEGYRISTADSAAMARAKLASLSFDLLILDVMMPGETVPRVALAGNGGGANERAVDVQVNRLRRKIERDPANPLFVQTVRGIGYRLVVAP
jgi:DNA-binding response OmpR family regulator